MSCELFTLTLLPNSNLGQVRECHVDCLRYCYFGTASPCMSCELFTLTLVPSSDL